MTSSSAPARALARAAGARGPTFATSAACASSAVARRRGAGAHRGRSLRRGDRGRDRGAPCLRLPGISRAASALHATGDALRRRRAGLSLGEGAAVLVLESLSHARAHGRRPIARASRGSGASTDGYDQVAPEPGGRGLIAASRRALARAGVPAEEVGGYHAHGTGTIQNDRMEAAVFAALFSGRDVTVSAIKGSVGHTLGAAGALDVAVCALMLQRRIGAAGHQLEDAGSAGARAGGDRRAPPAERQSGSSWPAPASAASTPRWSSERAAAAA